MKSQPVDPDSKRGTFFCDQSHPHSFDHVSFNASGVMSVFHFGVSACLLKHTDVSECTYYGASAGALVGGSILVGLSPYFSAESMLCHCEEISQDASRIEPLFRKTLDSLCPEDAHEKCSKRLVVSCSQWGLQGLYPVYFKFFSSASQLKDVLLASAHIPFISGLMPRRIQGHVGQFYDGVLTDPHPHPMHSKVLTPSETSIGSGIAANKSTNCTLSNAPPTFSGKTLRVAWHENCFCGCTKEEDKHVLTPSVSLHHLWCARPPSRRICRLVFYLGYWNCLCMLNPKMKGCGASCDYQINPETLLEQLASNPLTDFEGREDKLVEILCLVWPLIEEAIRSEQEEFEKQWMRNEMWNIFYLCIQARRSEILALASPMVLLSAAMFMANTIALDTTLFPSIDGFNPIAHLLELIQAPS
eukprot:gene10578-2701_t